MDAELRPPQRGRLRHLFVIGEVEEQLRAAHGGQLSDLIPPGIRSDGDDGRHAFDLEPHGLGVRAFLEQVPAVHHHLVVACEQGPIRSHHEGGVPPFGAFQVRHSKDHGDPMSLGLGLDSRQCLPQDSRIRTGDVTGHCAGNSQFRESHDVRATAGSFADQPCHAFEIGSHVAGAGHLSSSNCDLDLGRDDTVPAAGTFAVLSRQESPSQVPIRLEHRVVVPAPGFGGVSLRQIKSGNQHLVPCVIGRGREGTIRMDDGGMAVARLIHPLGMLSHVAEDREDIVPQGPGDGQVPGKFGNPLLAGIRGAIDKNLRSQGDREFLEAPQPAIGTDHRTARNAVHVEDTRCPARVRRREIADQLIETQEEATIRTNHTETVPPPVRGKAGDHEGRTEDRVNIAGTGRVSDRIHRLLQIFVRGPHGRTQGILGKDDKATITRALA